MSGRQQEPQRRSSRRSDERGTTATAVGNYLIGSEIGRGSFATVYKGRHRSTGQRVAIKCVSRSKLTKKLLENLESEIKILKSVRHPHVVHLTDCLKTEAHIYLMMEYCALGDLTDFIKRRADRYGLRGPAGGLKEPVVRHFLGQLTSALEFLRSRNLIHRDIKPQNLLLLPNPLADSSGNGNPLDALPTLKIADFGFARFLPSQAMAETLCGSPLYMAPEILRYEKYDAKADLWSVGAVLYEMCCGRPPFHAQNHMELLRRIEKRADRITFPEDKEPEPGVERPVVAEDLKDLIRKLLKRNPVERITFEEFFQHPCVVDRPTSTMVVPGPTALAAEALNARRRDGFPESVSSAEESMGRRSNLPHSNLTSAIDALDIGANRNPQARIIHRVTAVSPYGTGPRRPSAGSPAAIMAQQAAAEQPTITVRDVATDAIPIRDEPGSARSSPRLRATPLFTRSPGLNGANGLNESPPTVTAHNRRESFLTTTSPDECDYVVVEKQSVQVNALADDIAASPHVTPLHSRQPSVNPAMETRCASPGHTAFTAQQSNAVAVGISACEPTAPRTIPGVHGALDTGRSANGRYNNNDNGLAAQPWSIAQPSAGGQAYGSSPPSWAVYARRPYLNDPLHTQTASSGTESSSTLRDADEESMLTIDTAACQAYAVFKFADRKLAQLLDIPVPSDNESGPDQSATQSLADEALVLYLCALSSLQRGIDAARRYWEDLSRGSQSSISSKSPRSAPQRLNDAVQWMRDQFNATLEKAEFTKTRASADERLSETRIEHLLYYHAMEISRTAAINELVGDNLAGCDSAYQQATWMLGALLDDPDVSVAPDDRNRIEDFILSIHERLQTLHRRMEPVPSTDI